MDEPFDQNEIYDEEDDSNGLSFFILTKVLPLNQNENMHM